MALKLWFQKIPCTRSLGRIIAVSKDVMLMLSSALIRPIVSLSKTTSMPTFFNWIPLRYWKTWLYVKSGNHRLKSSARQSITFMRPPWSQHLYLKIIVTVNDLLYQIIRYCCVVWLKIIYHKIQNWSWMM